VAPTTYEIDGDASKVLISARSSLHPIESETRGLSGFFEAEVLGGGRVNPEVTPKAELELPVQEMTSGNPLYDREMRRRIDARRYPIITGALQSMKATDKDGEYLVSGEISFKGVTRSYEDRMTLTFDSGSLRLQGEHVFDIRDFGMEPPKILTLRVYPDVTVRVDILARQKEN
jgi:polyisoprenoid-binding protein YceI